MVDSRSEMSGLEKATILLMSLGSEASGEILKHLSLEQRELLGARIVTMRPVRNVTQQRVIDEARKLVGASFDPSPDTVAPMHEASLSGQELSEASEPPLKWMERLAPDLIADLLEAERPQNVALVISRLSPQVAAGVLGSMEEKLRNQAAHRLATLGPVADEAISAVDQAMRKRLDKAKNSAIPDRRSEPPTAPEDLIFLPDARLREVLSRISVDNLRLVMSIASEDLRSAVLANAPDDIAIQIKLDEIGADRPRVRDIEAAQQALVEEARAVLQGAEPAGVAA